MTLIVRIVYEYIYVIKIKMWIDLIMCQYMYVVKIQTSWFFLKKKLKYEGSMLHQLTLISNNSLIWENIHKKLILQDIINKNILDKDILCKENVL